MSTTTQNSAKDVPAVPLQIELRDYFAGQVIEQCMRNALNDTGGWDPDNVAHHAYLLADALLAARAVISPAGVQP